MRDIDSQQFWDGKILRWEGKKYDTAKGGIRHFLDINRSLKIRMQITERVLKQIVKDRTVLEIGCGTSRLLPTIIQSGAKKYIGIDVSKVAIEQAQSRAKELGASMIVAFHQADAVSLEGMAPDICFSLGLLDWLEPSEILRMIRRIRCQYYLHSFSERRPSLKLMLHRLYVYCLYGHRTGPYRPKYYTLAQMLEIFRSCYGITPKHFRSRSLSFGSFIFQLPDGITLRDE